MITRRSACISLCALVIVQIAVPATAADWPCCKADAHRSGVTRERLAFPLSAAWVYQPVQAPCPAWPEPGREMHRVDFDYAFQPVIAGGLVYCASSADDSVRALDISTGAVKWRFTTGAPVRCAPHVAAGKCYAASDDGCAYCLDAGTGRLLWRFRAAPEDRQIVGNGRMISRWPCRSGVLVLDGAAYVTAGMWPAEGIYVYALDAETGRQLWCNDTSGHTYRPYPHPGSYAIGGVAPQGYLAAWGDVLLVPTGRNVPAAFDRTTGRLLYYDAFADWHDGGCWATVAGDIYFNAGHIRLLDRHVMLGEAGPQEGDGIVARSLATGEQLWRVSGRHRVLARGSTMFAVGSGAVEALPLTDEGPGKPLWTATHPRAYCAALAGDSLLIGGAGTITAFGAADGKQKWRAEIEGQARGLAVAGGRIVAATNKGAIYCFTRAGAGGTTITHDARGKRPAPLSAAVAAVVDGIARAGITRGFALVIGAEDAALAEAVAAHTQLRVIGVLRDGAGVAAERRRLLDTTDLYGSRVAVHHLDDPAHLPYAQYFANVVIVAGQTAEITGEELYRVLRPCGGLLCFAGVGREAAEKLIGQANVPQGEIHADGDSITVVRGKLAGAFDWDSKVIADELVRWPLELLWFGGPGPARMVARHWSADTPIAANGRYFAIGEYHLIGVDAYNGCELWSRELGQLWANRTPVAADDSSVYINFKDACLELDARTGEARRIYGQPKVTRRLSTAQARTFELNIDDTHTGTVTIRKTEPALELTLATRDPAVTSRDSWELFFDFRPPSERSASYGPGAFQIIVIPVPDPAVAAASWHPGVGPTHPRPVLKGKDAEEGTCVVCELTWDEIRDLTGTTPKDFAFAVTLNSYDGGPGPPTRVHKFADGGAGLINNGWAAFVLEPYETGPEASRPPHVRVIEPEKLPAHARTWGRLPPSSHDAQWRFPEYARRCGSTAFSEDDHWRAEEYAGLMSRIRPLTAERARRAYRRAYGCGGVISSATMDFFRSGTIGFYDLEDDSGLRNFAAIRPGCGMTMNPALGLLISSQGDASCTCSYNFQTSAALAPAARRRNEDWAVFFDDPQNAFIQRAALNLGAPGDRSVQDNGRRVVWLGLPRPQSMMGVPRERRLDLGVPLSLLFCEGFGPYRFNADRVTVSGTELPWIYTSGLRGLQRATLDMEFFGPGAVSLLGKQRPTIDGLPDESCWGDDKRIAVAEGKASVVLRHDDDNLYVAYAQPAAIDRRGNSTPWKAAARGTDAAVWDDDSFELYLSDAGDAACLHLGVSASGATYDALWNYEEPFPVFDVPRLDGIAVDGDTGDWGDRGFQMRSLVAPEGKMCPAEDFDPSFRLGWDDRGLLVLVQVRDDVVREYATPGELWQADSIELFMSSRRGSGDVFQMAAGTGADERYPETRTFFWDNRKTRDEKLTAEAAGRETPDGYQVEVLLPWKNLEITPTAGMEIGFQIFNNDSDGDGATFRTMWHPLGHAFWNREALHRVRLAAEPSPPVGFMRGDAPGEDGLFTAVPPYPFPLVAVSLGRRGEDGGWDGGWSCARRADEDAFSAELAIPWETLADAGLDREKLIIDLESRGKLRDRPSRIPAFKQVFFRADEKIAPRSFTVRLHFGELDGAGPGDRVFDVKLQGKTMLKDFDVVRAAGGPNRAVVREFNGVVAAATMTLELIPKAGEMTDKTAPIISGIEVAAE